MHFESSPPQGGEEVQAIEMRRPPTFEPRPPEPRPAPAERVSEGLQGDPFSVYSPGGMEELIRRAADSRSVHGIKLIDALARFDRDADPVWRSVAEQWFEWV